MSHGKTVIELADGLTVLTGPNNCGKSALVSALQIVASNGRTKHVMRHGSKVCRITVETDDDQTIVWERKKSTVKYTINGEDVHRVGQGVPENLHESLRLAKVTTESGATKNEYDIHFGEQKSPVFLLNETGSRAAAFFASSSDAASLVEMQHLHRTRTTRARSDAKRFNQESERNIARIAAFAPIDSISESVKAAEKLQDKLTARQQHAEALAATIERLKAVAGQVTRWNGESKILASLDLAKTTPNKLLAGVENCERLRTCASTIANQTRTRDYEQSRFRTLSPLLPLPILHPAADLKTLIDRLKETHRRHHVTQRIANICAPIVAPPIMQPAESCRQISKNLAAAIENQAALRRVQIALADLTPPSPTRDIRSIYDLTRQLTTAIRNHATMKTRLSATSQITPPPTVEPTQPLRQTIARLLKEQKRRDTIVRKCRNLQTLRAIEPTGDPQPLTTIVERLKQLDADVREAKTKADAANALVLKCQQSIHEFVKTNPKCATCGGSIDSETLMSSMPGMHEHSDDEPLMGPPK